MYVCPFFVLHIHVSASPISKFDCSQLITIVIVELNLCSMIQCCSLQRKTNHIFSFGLTTCYHIDIIDSDVFRDKCISRAGTRDGGHLTGHHVPVGFLPIKPN